MREIGNFGDLSPVPVVSTAGDIDERMKEMNVALKNFRADYLFLMREIDR